MHPKTKRVAFNKALVTTVTSQSLTLSQYQGSLVPD